MASYYSPIGRSISIDSVVLNRAKFFMCPLYLLRFKDIQFMICKLALQNLHSLLSWSLGWLRLETNQSFSCSSTGQKYVSPRPDSQGFALKYRRVCSETSVRPNCAV